MLYCSKCGCCSGELGKGWAAFCCDEPDANDSPAVAIYCPVCAASEFGYRPDVAARYVCAWEPGQREAPPVDDLGQRQPTAF